MRHSNQRLKNIALHRAEFDDRVMSFLSELFIAKRGAVEHLCLDKCLDVTDLGWAKLCAAIGEIIFLGPKGT